MSIADDIRIRHRANIASFLEDCREYFGPRVLDYGAGGQPYKHIIEPWCDEYHAFDRKTFAGSVVSEDIGILYPFDVYDTVVCTQVIHLVQDPRNFLIAIRDYMDQGSHLLMTYQVNWPVVDPDDKWRFTMAGIEDLLKNASFETVRHEEGSMFAVDDLEFTLENHVVAKAI